MNPEEIRKRIESIKASLDEAFDKGRIDFDAIKEDLEEISAAVAGLQLPPNPSPAESAEVNPQDFR